MAVGSPGISVGVDVLGTVVDVPSGVNVNVAVSDTVGIAVNVAVCVDVGEAVGEALGCGVAEGSTIVVDVGDGEFSAIGIKSEGRAVTIEGIEIAWNCETI